MSKIANSDIWPLVGWLEWTNVLLSRNKPARHRLDGGEAGGGAEAAWGHGCVVAASTHEWLANGNGESGARFASNCR